MNRYAVVGIIIIGSVWITTFDFWTSAELIGSILFIFPLAMCALQLSTRLDAASIHLGDALLDVEQPEVDIGHVGFAVTGGLARGVPETVIQRGLRPVLTFREQVG
jgi:hypothetical protein